jgi:hypothetical protein
MEKMTIKRQDLIDVLKKNLEVHRDEFVKAQEGYRREAIKELDRMLDDARKGNKILRAISMPEPTDHSDDYKSAIRMLEMCVDPEIEITAEDFDRLVMDDWGWKGRWSATNATYS